MQCFWTRHFKPHDRSHLSITVHVYRFPSFSGAALMAGFSLHVKIYDTANQQFTIPESVIERPAAPKTSYTGNSDLLFNFDAAPFAFWVTRRSDPGAMPLFDTRTSSLPPTPIPPFNASDPSTAFDGFPLVFEDQYLQVCIHHSTETINMAYGY